MKSKVIETRLAGLDHAVTSVISEGSSYRREPCVDFPWKKSATGVFPAEAFEHSANTAYDLSTHLFGCHQSGTSKPATCAGFLLNGSDHNLSARMGRITGKFKNDVTDGGHDLHPDYRHMAIANGVDANSEALKDCR